MGQNIAMELEVEDFCSNILTVEEEIQTTEKLIQGAQLFVEKYTAEKTNFESRLYFLNTFDLADSCR